MGWVGVREKYTCQMRVALVPPKRADEVNPLPRRLVSVRVGAGCGRSSGGMASDGRSRAARCGGRAAWRRASRGRSSRAATWTAGRAEARGRVEDGQRLGVKPWERQRGRRSQARPRSGWSLREPAVGRFGRQQRGTARTRLDLSARDAADDGGTTMPRALKRPDPKIKAKPCINYRIRSPT